LAAAQGQSGGSSAPITPAVPGSDADTIAALREENARLTAANGQLQSDLDNTMANCAAELN